LKTATLALATTAALGVPMMANAITTTYSSAAIDYTFARNIFGSSTSTVATPLALSINSELSDTFFGNTDGFNVRITLSRGLFDSIAIPTVGTGLPPSTSIGPVDPWTVALGAGGAGDNEVVFSVSPPNDPEGAGIVEGALVEFLAGDIVLDNLTGLGTAGTTVIATITVTTPGFPDETTTRVLFVSVEGVVIDYDTDSTGSLPGNVNPNTRIDVGVVDPFETKTRFSPDGSIANTADTELFNAGAINYSVQGLATGFGGLNNNGGDFGYVANSDTFTTVVTGLDFGPFSDGTTGTTYLSSSDSCATGAGVSIAGTVNDDGASATYVYLQDDIGGTATGGTAYVCFNADGVTLIEQQNIEASTTVNLTDGNALDPIGAYTGTLLPMLYNGSIVKVATINPAGNTTAQSFLRITNPYSVGGLVTIVGTDDAGNNGDTDITFNLDAGDSIQITSDELENGSAEKGLTGAWGDGAGKWRALVTGEFDFMRVASLNRNSTDGTVTNLTNYDTNAEQVSETFGVAGVNIPLNKGSDPQY
jgi:hypothetical protein